MIDLNATEFERHGVVYVAKDEEDCSMCQLQDQCVSLTLGRPYCGESHRKDGRSVVWVKKEVEENSVFDVMADEDDMDEVFTVEEWRNLVEIEAFIPTDGIGFWGIEQAYSYKYNAFKVRPRGATHVHWFNK